MLAGSSEIETVELCQSWLPTDEVACMGDLLWAALDSNSSLKYCNLGNHGKYWNDMIMYYTTWNKLDHLFSRDETTTIKLWILAMEAPVRNQCYGKSLIFHLVRAKALLFVREGG